jgi:hypothetical protein
MLGPFWIFLKFYAGIHPWTGNLCWSCSAIRKRWDRMKPDEMLHWRCSCHVVDCVLGGHATCFLVPLILVQFEASFPEVEQWKHVETQYPRCCPWHAPSSSFPSSVSSWWAMSPGWEALSWKLGYVGIWSIYILVLQWVSVIIFVAHFHILPWVMVNHTGTSRHQGSEGQSHHHQL